MNIKNNKITVIVPAYNSQNTIERCLNSIINQKYDNLEIIVVNDGSTDNTEEIISQIRSRDSRVHLISIPNGGVSHARNVGIENATGDYITFVDSDDFIDSGMYEKLVQIIKKYSVKIAHCSYKNVNESGVVLSVVGNKGKIVKQSHDEAMSCLLSGNLFAGGLWNKIYDITLFSDVRLDETIKFNEDVLANYCLFDKVEASVYIDEAFYNYVEIESSSTHSADAVVLGQQTLYVSKKMFELSTGKNYEEIAKNRVAVCTLGLYRAYIFSDDFSLNEEKKNIMTDIMSYKKQGFYHSKKEKTLVFLYKYVPHLFRGLFRLYDKIRVKKLDPEQ